MKTYKFDCFFTNTIQDGYCFAMGILGLWQICSGVRWLLNENCTYGVLCIIIGLGVFILSNVSKIALPIRYMPCSVTVDKKELRFIFATEKSKDYYVGFNDIKSVHIIRNPAFFRGPFWLVNIKTYKGHINSMAIPDAVINDFYSDSLVGINKIVNEDNF